mmetsp:Transcript_48731/g.137763  ORF Transcript_48731/g.137763 Transcript_48731/m.137763 type:complete len:257 (-) Transcript_48731:83-853(-)
MRAMQELLAGDTESQQVAAGVYATGPPPCLSGESKSEPLPEQLIMRTKPAVSRHSAAQGHKLRADGDRKRETIGFVGIEACTELSQSTSDHGSVTTPPFQSWTAEDLGCESPNGTGKRSTSELVGIDLHSALQVQAALAAMTASSGCMQERRTVMRDLDDIAEMMCPFQMEPMSIGSSSHRFNTCKPCIFWARGICSTGRLCKYCHHLHTGSNRLDPLRRARARARQLVLEDMPTREPQLLVWSNKGKHRKLSIRL